MKCEICGKDILKDSQCIDYKYYHNDCIINLTKETKELKEHIEKYEHYCKTTGIEELQQENKELQERINKAIKYIHDNLIISSILDGKKYYTINNYSFDYKELLDILKGVE